MKRTATLAYLRQLCRLPLASEQLIPHALPSIVDMAKASAAVFVWQACGSRHAHLWSTADLPAAAMQRCLQRLDGRQAAVQLAQITQDSGDLTLGDTDRPVARAAVKDEPGWLHGLGKRRSPTSTAPRAGSDDADSPTDSASNPSHDALIGTLSAADLVAQPDADHDILCSLGVSHLAWLMIGPAHAPIAQLVLYRERGRKPFEEETIEALRQVQHYLERAVLGAQPPTSTQDHEGGLVWVDSGEEASVLLGPGDAIIDASYLAATLLSRVTDQPATGVTDLRTMVHQLRATCEAQRLESIKGAAQLEQLARRRRSTVTVAQQVASLSGIGALTPASIAAEIRNPWGRFVIRFDQLSSAGLVCLSLRRQEAEVLALLRRIADQQLSPQQREVILRLGLGMSNAEIAVDLGVTEATAKTHVKLLLKRLGVKDRYRAVALMLRPPAVMQDHVHT